MTSNFGAQNVTLQTLFDDDGSTVADWVPGQTLAPGETASPTAVNGLIRPFVIPVAASADVVSRRPMDGRAERRRVSGAVAGDDNHRSCQAADQGGLDGQRRGPACPTTTGHNAQIANDAYGVANYCLTLTNLGTVGNLGNITLTHHTVSIPALGIDNATLNADLRAIVTPTLVITTPARFLPPPRGRRR